MAQTCVGVGTSHSLHEKLEKVSQNCFSPKMAPRETRGHDFGGCAKQNSPILTKLSNLQYMLHSAPIIVQELQKH